MLLRDYAEDGLPLQNMLVIDVHCHLGFPADPYVPYQDEEKQLLSFNQTLKRVGVDYFIVSMLRALKSGELEANLDLARMMHTNRNMLGYVTYIPFLQEKSLEIAERCFVISDRFVGMKIHPDLNKYPINGPAYRPMWEFANAKKLFVLVHTWGQSAYSNPVLLHDIARIYKDVKILIGHSGGEGAAIITAIDLSNQYENLFLDLTGSFIYSRRTLEDFVRLADPDKLLFSSDSTYNNLAWEIGNILYSRVPDEVKEKVLGLNAKRLFHNFI
ncbi:amidohydrolase family protein [Paenibacillus eucommiae]|uniref:TIM-barrel fold metal-dependent hydrolase n=1 Tax=Paenibacillus eucommiae TaxID=1355755 RepID=A0ABS4IXF0_9BACL|nr:amidohydrolase family protein [Paenibacillus eucommiae]MBP1992262.1 putative TIM-barrel fold metal-dependent hydrolase [Paenibacillus eucommiae]